MPRDGRTNDTYTFDLHLNTPTPKHMTLREELEILRGEPIQVWEGDPKDIPCIETSDPELLCKHPVVSVRMITYNHEPYIRQAIEGVMMQKTDFEFELVIGEDCSQDKTREICFELQKKYPDKIRVLWWHENVSKLGGNGRRVSAHCRGEFIAICEGDDYWIDPLKLQKQVDAFRRHPSVGICFCGSFIKDAKTGTLTNWDGSAFTPGVIASDHFLSYTIFGKNPRMGTGPEGFVMTATLMVRAGVLKLAKEKYELLRWKLFVGDTSVCAGVGSIADAYFLADNVSVYAPNGGGSMSKNGVRVMRDSNLIRLYFAVNSCGLALKTVPDIILRRIIFMHWFFLSSSRDRVAVRRYGLRLGCCFASVHKHLYWRYMMVIAGCRLGIMNRFYRRAAAEIISRLPQKIIVQGNLVV